MSTAVVWRSETAFRSSSSRFRRAASTASRLAVPIRAPAPGRFSLRGASLSESSSFGGACFVSRGGERRAYALGVLVLLEAAEVRAGSRFLFTGCLRSVTLDGGGSDVLDGIMVVGRCWGSCCR